MQCILVTGGYGFIGSNYINYIYDIPEYSHYKIINVDKITYCSNFSSVRDDIKNSNRYEHYLIDISDHELLKKVFMNNDICIVVHFAAQSHVDTSFIDPMQFTRDNVIATQTLLECCRTATGVRRFIHISTDEVYGDISSHETCHETTLLNPTNPYSASKACAEMIVNSYIYSYKFPAIIIRGNNVYGEFQYPEKLIPKFIKFLKEGKSLTIHGDGTARRNFIHVNDFCIGINTVIEKGIIGQIYNIGTNNEYSVLEIANMLIKYSHTSNAKVIYIDDRLYNDSRYSINCDKLSALGWKPIMNFEESLKDLIYLSKL